MDHRTKKIISNTFEELEAEANKTGKNIGILMYNYTKGITEKLQHNPSEETKKQYREIFDRLVKKNPKTPLEIILYRSAQSRATFDLYRSAMRYCITEEIRNLLKESDQARRSKNFDEMREKTILAFKKSIVFEDKFLSVNKIVFEDVKGRDDYKKKKNSKKKVLKKAVSYNEIFEKLSSKQKAKYGLALPIFGMSGVRPAELKKGVIMTAKNGEITFTIRGAKISKDRGQEIRLCRCSINKNLLADNVLYKIIESSGQKGLLYKLEQADYKALSKYLNRNFPDMSAYVFRHQVASNLKANKMSKIKIAQYLGHRSDKSQSAYGYVQNHRDGRTYNANAVAPVKEKAVSYIGKSAEQQPAITRKKLKI